MAVNRIKNDAALYAVGSILAKIASFLLLPIYTRYLTTAEYGIIELVELTINVTAIMVGLGAISGAMIRIYHEYDDLNNKKLVVSSTLISVFFVSFFLLALGIVFSEYISIKILHDIRYSRLVSLAFVGVLLSSQIETSLVYMRIKEKALFFVIYSFIQLIIMISLNIYFIVFAGLGVWGFVYSKLITFSLGMLFLWFIIFKEIRLSFNYDIFRKILSFGAPLIAMSVAFFIIHFSDRFFLSHYATMDDVGIYSLGYKFGFLITFLVGEPFGRAWNAQLFAYVKEEGWKERFSKVFFFFFLALSIVWLGLSVFGYDVISIVAAPSFRGAASIIPGIALAYLFRELGDFFKNILFINKRSGLVSKIAIICAVINLLANFFLIQAFGMIGAVLSTIITWFSYMILLYYFSLKEHAIPYEKGKISTLFLLSCGLYGLAFVYVPQSLLYSIGFHLSLFLTFLLYVWIRKYLTLDILKRNA